MKNETIEARMDRLEYYINIMRDYSIDPKKFQFWDWAMSKKLNRYEVRAIIDITKAFDRKFDNGEIIDLNDYCDEIENLLKWENRQEDKEPINKLFIVNMLESLKILMFKDVINKLLESES